MAEEKATAYAERFAQYEGLALASTPANEEIDPTWCLRFLRSIRDVAFATVDESGLPSVRIIDVMAVTSDRLYFLAPRGKAFHADAIRESFVAIVGQTPDFRTCRLRGHAARPEGIDDQHALVDAIFELNPSMNLIYPGDRRYICDVFCIDSGEGEYFDLGQKPIFRYPFSIGDKETTTGTFLITNACTECGACAGICPENCIKVGTPYEIDQAHCLRCGICQEACPAYAVQKK